jgi:hypothetical protein
MQADSDGVNAPFGLSIAVLSATLAVQAGLQGFDTLRDTYYVRYKSVLVHSDFGIFSDYPCSRGSQWRLSATVLP